MMPFNHSAMLPGLVVAVAKDRHLRVRDVSNMSIAVPHPAPPMTPSAIKPEVVTGE